jgi:hypothetical protein
MGSADGNGLGLVGLRRRRLPRGAGPVDTSRALAEPGQPGCTVKPARRDAERRILVVQAHVTPRHPHSSRFGPAI